MIADPKVCSPAFFEPPYFEFLLLSKGPSTCFSEGGL